MFKKNQQIRIKPEKTLYRNKCLNTYFYLNQDWFYQTLNKS